MTSRRTKKQKKHKKRRYTRKRRLQYGGDNGSCIVFTLSKNAGFFSVFFFLCHAYLVAKQKGVPFYIEHENWPFTYKNGWHDYFTSLNYYDASANMNCIRYGHLNYDKQFKFTNKQYAQAIQEIFTPTDDIVALVNSTRENLGNPYTAIMIRKGDKVKGATKEMDDISIDEIFRITAINQTTKELFIMTDDYECIQQSQAKLPTTKIVTLATEKESGFYLANFSSRTPEEIAEHTRTLIASSILLTKASPAWSDIRSNTGRFHKLLSMETVQLYPNVSEIDPEKAVEPWHGI